MRSSSRGTTPQRRHRRWAGHDACGDRGGRGAACPLCPVGRSCRPPEEHPPYGRRERDRGGGQRSRIGQVRAHERL
eukprot:2725059-Pyramimonas_sp.AAC.1